MTKFTNIHDVDGKPLYVGDRVQFLGTDCTVHFASAAYGIKSDKPFDWAKIKAAMPTGEAFRGAPYFCYNDHFISFWEIMWNFECEEERCEVLKKIKNQYYFTFGSDPLFPFQYGYLIILAEDWEKANDIFRQHFPNREGSNCLNCAFRYDSAAWETVMERRKLHFATEEKCHGIFKE